MRNLIFALLLFAMSGCTYHSQTKDPVSPATYEATPYRSADSVGKLRRLVLMPVEIESYRGKYASVKEQEAAALSYGEACANFLIEKKGYEIVVVRDADGKWRGAPFEDLGYENIQDLYKGWREEAAEKHPASAIQKIAGALNVDGVLVIRIKERKPWGIIGGLLNIALMDIPLFYNIASPDRGAWIYETATGRLVWSEEHSSFGNETTSATDSLIKLFADLENAVPLQIIK